MKTQGCICCIAAALFAAVPAFAQIDYTCDKIYNGPIDGEWDVAQWWMPPVVPGPLDRVCIPPDKSVQLHGVSGNVDGYCKSLWIQYNHLPATQRGVVRIRKGSRLHVTHSSMFNGTLSIEKGAQLRIEGDMNIVGEGGEIVGLRTGLGSEARIVLVDHTLWLSSLYPIDPPALLTVHGALEIGCEYDDPCPSTMLVNNAIVVADDGELRIGPLAVYDPLDSTAVGGAYGVWRAERAENAQDDGRLLITVPVLGSAVWELIDNAASEIILDESSTKLFGPMTIQKGTLRIRGDIKTTGNLAFTSVAGSSPSIVLENGSSAEFGN